MTALVLPWNGVAPAIDASAFVAPTATLIGDVAIGAGSSVWFGCVLRADLNRIRIGARVNIQDGTVFHVSTDAPCEVGDGVSIGHMALVHGCRLEPGSFVGMMACVMDGCVVETGAIVAGGAIVPPGKRVPTGELWGGNPARKLRDLEPRDYEMIRRVVTSHVSRGAAYRAALADYKPI